MLPFDIEVKYMGIKKDPTNHFIDDQGVYVSNKEKHTAFFVTFCRILTFVMIFLGIVALIVGNM
jgi:hypothetical protein